MFSLHEYHGLDVSGLEAAYRKVTTALAQGDFRVAQAKKLAGSGKFPVYRARLNDADRLLFTFVRCGERVGVLALDVVRAHAYDKSRFLRGAGLDALQIAEASGTEATLEASRAEALPLRYLHPQRTALHLLDKPLSFDDAQQAVFERPAPLIVVGSAGSGKTALTLERLKQEPGEVLYVTQSAFLARSARDLYFGHGFERDDQEPSFLSYLEFLESLRVPRGREATWCRFKAWFARQRQAFKGLEAHQTFEEIRGVITAPADGVLSREAYLALGVKQSIYAGDERAALYELFERYRDWLREDDLFDLNLLAHERMAEALPRYDFVVIDEAQDLTPVQLALVLRCLKTPGNFLLCGDSNQIVHPNFFSWSQVKTLFWRDAELAGRQQLSVLSANFRNAAETTRIANGVLKIKHARFGSIDRESNFLVEAVAADAGIATVLPDKEGPVRDLDRQSRASTEIAVLVMREEDKPAARARFGTPLLFSVQEAKGLEYPNIVLYRFVSDNRAEFAAIAEGVTPDDLASDALAYRRGRDKSDKSAEVYKFFVNALYVAITRAVRNVYLVESDTEHPLLRLLAVNAVEQATVQARIATREDWQREAHRLEQQGKLEQAEAIRRNVLHQARPPWTPFDEPHLRESLHKTFIERNAGGKLRQQLLDYAALVDAPDLAEWMGRELGFGSRAAFESQRPSLRAKVLAPFAGKNLKDVLKQCDQYSLDHLSPFGFTPLMGAVASGNLALVDALLERGADVERSDDYGCAALHWALREAFERPDYARTALPALYERLAPPALDVQAGERLLRIDRRQGEYLLMQTLWATFRTRFVRPHPRALGEIDAGGLLATWMHLPASVLKLERNKRSAVSGLLSRNEVDSSYAYSRALFRRTGHGWYQFNPTLRVRVRQGEETAWVPLLQRLNIGLVNELCVSDITVSLHAKARAAGLGELPIPLAGLAAHARAAEERKRIEEAARQREAELRKQEAQWRRLMEKRAAPPRKSARTPPARSRSTPPPFAAADIAPAAPPTEAAISPRKPRRDPPWGTPEAKRLALQRLMQRNAGAPPNKDDDGDQA